MKMVRNQISVLIEKFQLNWLRQTFRQNVVKKTTLERKRIILIIPQQIIKICWQESTKLLVNREFIADSDINVSHNNFWHNNATFFS